MSFGFSQTLHELESDNPRRSILMVTLVTSAISLWAAWLFVARLPLYRTTDKARLIIDKGYAADASVAGRIAAIHVTLGQEVHAGDLLIELNSETRQSELAQDRAELRGATDALRISSDIARRYRASSTGVSKVDVLRAQAQEESDRAKLNFVRLDIERLQYEIQKSQIRAPIGGRVAGLGVLRVGAYLREGDEVATIVPPGPLKALAEFDPGVSLGRIHPGQSAWLHLSGFPWTQYGTIAAKVESVASEPTPLSDSTSTSPGTQRDSGPPEKRIRVELTIDPTSAPRIPIRYGLPGTVEVEVERISPVQLIMRAAGQLMTRPTV